MKASRNRIPRLWHSALACGLAAVLATGCSGCSGRNHGKPLAAAADGFAGGKVTFESVIEKNGSGGNRFVYKVTNRSGDKVTIEWAGYTDTIEPGGEVAHEKVADSAGSEETGSATIRDASGRESIVPVRWWSAD